MDPLLMDDPSKDNSAELRLSDSSIFRSSSFDMERLSRLNWSKLDIAVWSSPRFSF